MANWQGSRSYANQSKHQSENGNPAQAKHKLQHVITSVTSILIKTELKEQIAKDII